MTTSSENQQHFNRVQGYIVCLGAILLAFEIWAVFNNESDVLTIIGLGSAFLLLVIPLVITIAAARSTLRELQNSYPLGHYVTLCLRRNAALLTFAAVVLIPLCVVGYFYLQVYISAFFSTVFPCSDYPCTVTPSATPPATLLLQTVWSLAVVIGLWGMNILASILAAGIAIRSRSVGKAVAGTFFVLVLAIAVMYQFLNAAKIDQPYTIAIAALLPYGLACIASLLLQRPTAQQHVAPTHE